MANQLVSCVLVISIFSCSYTWPEYCVLTHLNAYLVCGRGFDSLSYGVLWPVTEANEVASVFCSDIIPTFGFGPYATRRCRENGTWDTVDTSQCSVRPTQQYTIILYSTYVMSTNGSAIASLPEIEQVCLRQHF